MPYKTQFDKITNEFFDYLYNLGISKDSHKNYRSDIAHFSGWLLLTVRRWGASAEQLMDAIPFINQKLASQYKSYLMVNRVAQKTINRRLSTLRHLARFFLASQVLDFNFMQGITNIASLPKPGVHPLLPQFEKHLGSEKVSQNTIKSYLNDIKQFLSWLEDYGTESQFTNN